MMAGSDAATDAVSLAELAAHDTAFQTVCQVHFEDAFLSYHSIKW